MKKRPIALVLIIGFLLFYAFPVVAGQLDEKKVLSVIYERLKHDKKFEDLKPENLSIPKKIHVLDTNTLSLWAVRIFIQMGSNKQDMKVGALHLIIDDKAQWQFENMADLKSGQPLLEKAMAELTKIDLKTSIGQVVYRGKGTKNVVVVTDNFCPFCRSAYQALLYKYEDQIKELIFLYAPLPLHPGSELACAVSSFVYHHKSLKQHARQINDFIFQELKPPLGKDLNEANKMVLEALKSKFPWVAKEFSNLSVGEVMEKVRAGSTIEEQIKYVKSLNITATPILFVDGKRIDGFDIKKFERYLTY
jgi:glutaredoxin